MKELAMAKAETVWAAKVVLDYNLKYKVNVHEFMLNNQFLNKQIGSERLTFLKNKFQIIYVYNPLSNRWSLPHLPTPSLSVG